jgi:hypothetical protein
MQSQSIKTLPLPAMKGQKRIVQAEISPELFEAVKKEMKKRKYKITQIVEWGLQTFLLNCNEEEAKKLGVKTK